MVVGPVTRRLVFAAVIAFTDVPSADGRVLVTPPGFICPARDYPLPVFGRDPEPNSMAWRIGSIEDASVVDHRLIVFGRFDTSALAKTFVDQLADGTHRLEIDADITEYEQSAAVTGMPVPSRRAIRWALRSVSVGDHPAWDLPVTQMEELTCL